MQVRQPSIQIPLHFAGRLHCRPRTIDDLLRARVTPRRDEFGVHLDVALHAEVLAQSKGLVAAMRIEKQQRRSRYVAKYPGPSLG